MENRSYNIVIDYIAKEFNLNKSKLSLEVSLSDIGLDGDDVLDFLLKFFKEFKIDYEQTNYRDFIPREGGFLVSNLLSLFSKKKKIKDNNEIFVKDLVISLDKKKWYKNP
ncbi:MAG: DUF1493 family protein [Bacteroidales bacterium]|jgi:hypothetical protein|nr:DUF1493 family protein [Bacteroidales bacterium]